MIFPHQAHHTARIQQWRHFIFSLTLGHLATAHFIILNCVCMDFTCTFVWCPISFLSSSGKGCEPFTFSPLNGFFFNGVWCLMTPQLQYSMWLHICDLICFGATCSFLIHDWCFCNTSISNLCQGTHLPPLMV